jgi:alpha-tubulin suppressor-like RCC1 family protein
MAVEDGTAYSFGQGEWGKLGHGGAANEQHPKQLEVQGKITQIGVGDQHSVLLTGSALGSLLPAHAPL